MLQSALGVSRAAFHRQRSGSRRCLAPRCSFTEAGLSCKGAWRELEDRQPGMMTLIALAISVAFVFSAAVTLGYPGMPLWEELATLITIMLLGHWLEMRSISQATGALGELAKLIAEYCDSHRADHGPRYRANGGGTDQRPPRRRSRTRATGREHSGGRRGARGHQRRERSDDHRRIPSGRERAREQSHRRDNERIRVAPSRRDRYWRSHCARRNHAARRTGADVALPRASARRPCGVLAHGDRHSAQARSRSSRGSRSGLGPPTPSSV